VKPQVNTVHNKPSNQRPRSAKSVTMATNQQGGETSRTDAASTR